MSFSVKTERRYVQRLRIIQQRIRTLENMFPEASHADLAAMVDVPYKTFMAYRQGTTRPRTERYHAMMDRMNSVMISKNCHGIVIEPTVPYVSPIHVTEDPQPEITPVSVRIIKDPYFWIGIATMTAGLIGLSISVS
jgi:hypothetical protein